MAGAGTKLFVDGQILTAAQVNTYLQDQVIMRFANAATRDAAFGGVGEPTLAEGMFCYLDDTNTLQSYNGSAWIDIASSTQPPGLVHIHTGTFTNATEYIPPTDTFSTAYDHYLMKVTIDSFANSGAVYVQMRNSGGTSATEYRWGGFQSYSDSNITGAVFSAGPTNNGFLMQSLDYDNAVHDGIGVTMDLMNPSRAIYTSASCLTYAAINPQYYGRYLFQKHQVNTIYTNFRLNAVASGGAFTITGNVQLYGYRK